MILVDTNVILEYKKLKLFFRKKEIATTKPCLEEVKKLAEKDKVLLSLINGIKIIETKSQKADDSLIEAAEKYGLKVASFDRVLVNRLKEKNIQILGSDKEILSELK
jgi:rRNA-processing protein FCF1